MLPTVVAVALPVLLEKFVCLALAHQRARLGLPVALAFALIFKQATQTVVLVQQLVQQGKSV